MVVVVEGVDVDWQLLPLLTAAPPASLPAARALPTPLTPRPPPFPSPVLSLSLSLSFSFSHCFSAFLPPPGRTIDSPCSRSCCDKGSERMERNSSETIEGASWRMVVSERGRRSTLSAPPPLPPPPDAPPPPHAPDAPPPAALTTSNGAKYTFIECFTAVAMRSRALAGNTSAPNRTSISPSIALQRGQEPAPAVSHSVMHLSWKACQQASVRTTPPQV